ncbi:helix-turn-helix transcriptional regulator [uncultured Microscilla sp.]|uniref:helix-turn-helix domain-containing protein n=1 Tax=uncultured Microscilla sp. TaxID=432653 RepID=UPI00261A9C95|nr:helix-turn-helix transcriptional regulator [uncultured Microscilla sp.]
MEKTFADRLKELRKKKGLSQNQLAELIDVHFAQVSRYERGETKPNAQAITKLAQALNTTADYLMNGTSDDHLNQMALDKEIISRFKQIQELDQNEKKIVLSLLDAYIAKQKITHILGLQK